MRRQRSILTCLVLVLLAVSPSQAASIVPGTTVLRGPAIQDVTLLANTAFNPTSQDIVINDLFGHGAITLNRDAQVGTTITIATLAGGQFYGFAMHCWETHVFGNISPLTGADFSGIITNVVQDPSDPGFATGDPSSFQSGDFSFGGASFGF